MCGIIIWGFGMDGMVGFGDGIHMRGFFFRIYMWVSWGYTLDGILWFFGTEVFGSVGWVPLVGEGSIHF